LDSNHFAHHKLQLITSHIYQILQPNGAIIIIATRWADSDLIGRVLKDAAERGKADEWRVIEFPAILPSGNPLWPEFWSIDLLEALKEELPPSKWNAQYQQKPTGEEGAIVKRDWWRLWEKEEPPRCEFIIQAWDTAFTKNERSDFSACTTWGVFYLNEDPNDANIILLDSFQKRMEFPELKELAIEEYREWEPDAFIVEKKSSGTALYQELRRMGIPVQEFTPHRGTGDKVARLNTVSDIFRTGMVWYPAGRRWAEAVVEQVAAFPASENDDMVDCTSMALARFRNGGFIRLDSDYDDEPVGRHRQGGGQQAPGPKIPAQRIACPEQDHHGHRTQHSMRKGQQHRRRPTMARQGLLEGIGARVGNHPEGDHQPRRQSKIPHGAEFGAAAADLAQPR
jgi:predicted phage terminase large subunit-like protein